MAIISLNIINRPVFVMGLNCVLFEVNSDFLIQINHQLDSTVSPVYFPDVYLQLNMFRASNAHHQELNKGSSSIWFYLRIVVIAVLLFVVGPVIGDLF
jgi:hypothetical protein